MCHQPLYQWQRSAAVLSPIFLCLHLHQLLRTFRSSHAHPLTCLPSLLRAHTCSTCSTHSGSSTTFPTFPACPRPLPPPLLARLPFLSDNLSLTYAPAAPAPRTRGLPCGCHLSPCPGALTALHSGWEEAGVSGVSNHATQLEAKDRSMPEAPAVVKAKQLAALSRELLAGSCRSGLNITGGRRQATDNRVAALQQLRSAPTTQVNFAHPRSHVRDVNRSP